MIRMWRHWRIRVWTVRAAERRALVESFEVSKFFAGGRCYYSNSRAYLVGQLAEAQTRLDLLHALEGVSPARMLPPRRE